MWLLKEFFLEHNASIRDVRSLKIAALSSAPCLESEPRSISRGSHGKKLPFAEGGRLESILNVQNEKI